MKKRDKDDDDEGTGNNGPGAAPGAPTAGK